jgi:hypothetical protein
MSGGGAALTMDTQQTALKKKATGQRILRMPWREKQFFFEKKNQKTFAIMAYAAGEDRNSDVKVFCLFSLEKKTFSTIINNPSSR